MLKQIISVLKNIPHLAWIFFFFIIFILIKSEDLFIALQEDEVISLKNFVFVPWPNVFTQYNVPNNHILFNAINKFFLDACGISNLTEAIAKPALVRSINIMYVLFTFGFLYNFCRIFQGRLAAVLSLLFLISTAAFLNISLVARGYMLSFTLLSALLFFSAKVFHGKDYWFSIVVAICTAHLGFTNPSNYLYVGSMFVFCILAMVLLGKFRKGYFITIIGITAGIAVSFILYASVFSEVFDGSHRFTPIVGYEETLVRIADSWPHFFSYHYFLFPFIFVPFFIGDQKVVYAKKLSLFFIFFITPFIINLLLKTAAPPRVFSPSAISIAILFAFAVSETLKRINKNTAQQRVD